MEVEGIWSGAEEGEAIIYSQDPGAFTQKLFTRLDHQSRQSKFTDLDIGGFRCHKFILSAATDNGRRVSGAMKSASAAEDWLGLQLIQKVYPKEMLICLKYIYGQDLTLSPQDRLYLREFSKNVFSPVFFDHFLEKFEGKTTTCSRFEPWVMHLKTQIENEQTVSNYNHYSDVTFEINTKRIHCHKFLIAAMSPLFFDNEYCNYLTKKAAVISLDKDPFFKLSYMGVWNVIRYLYGQTLQIPAREDLKLHLEEAADYFQLESFKPSCVVGRV